MHVQLLPRHISVVLLSWRVTPVCSGDKSAFVAATTTAAAEQLEKNCQAVGLLLRACACVCAGTLFQGRPIVQRARPFQIRRSQQKQTALRRQAGAPA